MLKWKEQLSRAWGGQDLSKDAYDYDKYYRDQPVAAWMQLYNIEANKWNPYIKSAHFPDGGRSGLYKTPQHPTYPGLGNKSWSSDGSIYYLSNQQYMNPKDDHNTDDTLDYLGSDYGYNKGGTHVVYNGANVLPTLWVLPKDKGFNLRSNKYDNGFEYKDRKQDIKIPYKQYGGLIQKYQQGKPFFTEENKERIKKSTDKAVEAVKVASKKASDAYEDFSNSPWGTVYDVVNAGLYAAALFTGGATLVPAIVMSTGQGIAGANNMYWKGATVNNVADVVGGVLAAPGKMVATPIMKMVGKTSKRVNRALLFPKSGSAKETLWQMAKENKKYAPYATYVYGNLGINIGQIGNDLRDNYQTYVAPWVGYQNRLSQAINKETNKRK